MNPAGHRTHDGIDIGRRKQTEFRKKYTLTPQTYNIKGKNGKIIRYKQPGDSGFTNLVLSEVEKRLSRLKAQKGKDLYVQIIIPQDSGLTYNEAWDFMRKLLVKYDYYYQDN